MRPSRHTTEAEGWQLKAGMPAARSASRTWRLSLAATWATPANLRHCSGDWTPCRVPYFSASVWPNEPDPCPITSRKSPRAARAAAISSARRASTSKRTVCSLALSVMSDPPNLRNSRGMRNGGVPNVVETQRASSLLTHRGHDNTPGSGIEQRFIHNSFGGFGDQGDHIAAATRTGEFCPGRARLARGFDKSIEFRTRYAHALQNVMVVVHQWAEFERLATFGARHRQPLW